MSKLLSPLFTGRVEKGKFIPKGPALFKRAFFPHEGKSVDIQVKRHRETRSLNQNAYYFGVVIPRIADAIGEDDAEAVHELLKHELNYYMAKIGKAEMRITLSTANLDTAEFELYIERVRRWAAEFLNLYIELPNP